MKYLDRFLQQERIKRATPYVNQNDRVLDIGSNNGELFMHLASKGINVYGTGVDPNIEGDVKAERFELIKDYFPCSRLKDTDYNVIVMLAVLEHIPMDTLPAFSDECYKKLKPGGRLVITVPSKAVDPILKVLLSLRLIKGMELEQHYGYDIHQTRPIFERAGLRFVTHKIFQLGLNNLFVFQKP